MWASRSAWLAGAAVVAALTSPGSTIAQEQGHESGPSRTLEEVVVRAQRRAQSAQSVPVSVTAFTADVIASTGSQTLGDLAGKVPNFQWSDYFYPDTASIAIRGIFANVGDNAPGKDAGYGIYVDDVFIGSGGAAVVDLADVEQVEVLRGPQGTFFGRNTIAGAIAVQTRKPGNEFESKLDVDLGNYDLHRVKASVNLPIVRDVLAARVSISERRRDGYTRNRFNGDDLEQVDQVGGRVQVAYTPGGSTSVTFTADGLVSDYRFANAAKFTEEEFPSHRPHQADFDFPHLFDQQNVGASLKIEHELASGFTLTSITGYRDLDTFRTDDTDERRVAGLGREVTNERQVLSQELRVASPLGSRFDYIAGVYYLHQDNLLESTSVIGEDWLPTLVGRSTAQQVVNVESLAAFIDGNVYLTDRLTLFAGFRMTNDTKETRAGKCVDTNGLICSIFGSRTDYVAAPVDVDDTEPSWRGGLRYALTDDVQVYGKVSRSFKSGAINTSFSPMEDHEDGILLAEPETVTAYEIGTKASWFDRRLSLNFAAFYMDYADLQVRFFCPDCGELEEGANIFGNAAEVTSKGFEIELSALPADTLTLDLTVGYVDSTYDEFVGPSDTRSTALGGLGSNLDVSGNDVPNVPDWSVSAAAQHDLPLPGGGTWRTRVDYTYSDERFDAWAGDVNTADALIPSTFRWDVRTGYASPNGRWEAQLWVKNLTDEENYQQKSFVSFVVDGFHVKYEPPRTYGVNLAYRF